MDEKMQQDAVDTASKALAEYNIEKVRTCFLQKFVFVTLLESYSM